MCPFISTNLNVNSHLNQLLREMLSVGGTAHPYWCNPEMVIVMIWYPSLITVKSFHHLLYIYKTPPRKPSRGERVVSTKPRPKSVYDSLGLVYCFIV